MKRPSTPIQSGQALSLSDTLFLAIEAEEMRRSLKLFVMGAWSQIEPQPYVDGWCIDAICEHLTALTNEQIRFLLVNIPPRHSKSTICSVLWPVWCWLHKPEDRFLCASYGLSLAIRDNAKKLKLIESRWFQQRYGSSFSILANEDIHLTQEPTFTLSSHQAAKKIFANDRMGYQMAVSVGSTTTGEGGSKLLCLCHDVEVTTSIGRICIGDIVDKMMNVKILAFNHDTNTTQWEAIEQYESSPGRACVRVAFTNDRSIDMTTDHPVYVLGRGYVQAHKLTTTDEVMFGGVCTTFVHGIEPIPTPERVYNIRVANCHNYFASGILVHNCDDVHAASEAYSIADRENALRWFRETWSNRLNDASKDVMMVIGQRIHENDVSGLILEERKDWVHLNLPAEFEPARKCTTVLGWTDPRTVEGELLWPERFNAETLSRYKRDLGSMGFAAQYQQTPVPSEGGTFKKAWIRYFTETPVAYVLETSTGSRSVLKEACWRFTVVDLAISLKQSADYTVIATFDVTPQHDLLLIDMIRDHIDNPAQQKAIRMTYINLEPRFIKIESVGYQLAIIQTLRNTPEDVNHFLVTSANPEMLDQTLRQLPGGESFLMRDIFDGYRSPSPEVYVACVVGDVDFFKFSVEKQGYCTIVGQPGYDPHQVSIPVREYKPVKDKVSRASVAAIHMENEKLLFRKNDAMLPDVEGEVLRFPFGGHDDIVDILSMASDEVTYNKYSGLPMLLYTEEEAKVAAIEKEKEEKLNHERQLLGIPMLLEDDIEFK